MKRQIYLSLILLVIPVIFSEDHIYCTLPSCRNRTHTLCKYPDPGPVERCGNITQTGLSMDEKLMILTIYNRDRPIVHLYEQPNHLQPRPSNRRTLQYRVNWDRELAEIAQRWAEQCISTVDECRDVDRFDVRQRVGVDKASNFMPMVVPLVSDWFREDRLPSLNSLVFQGNSIEETAVTTANYLLSLMRQNENRIGCGAVRTYDNYYEYLQLVCNYGILESQYQD